MPIKKPNQNLDVNLESLENFKKFISNKNDEVQKNNIPKIKNKIFFDELNETEINNEINNLESENLNFDPFEEKRNEIKPDSVENNEIDTEQKINEYSIKEKNNKNLYNEEPNLRDLLKEKHTNSNQKTHTLNPLLRFKDPGISIKLPSLGFFYDDTTVSLETGKEINVYPMTAKDEILIRTPDFLLNGSAIESIIKNCCPSVHEPKKLLTNDIMAILLAIRWASYSENLNMETTCPECKKENTISISIPFIFDNMRYLKKEYVYELNKKLKIYLKPFTYDLVLKTAFVSFEESKIFQLIEKEDMKDEEKIQLAKKALDKIQETTIFCLSRSIQKIVIEDGETVNDPDMIEEWIRTIKIKDFDDLRNYISELNMIGLPTKIMTKCAYCNHEYELDIRYDPASFFE